MIDEETTVYPTHKCFDDALDFLGELAKQENPMLHSGRLLLVHAIVLDDKGQEHAHAFVEQDEKFVIFAGIHKGKLKYFAATVKEYYADARVKETTKYTPKQAALENLRSGHYGPWVERYRQLCGGEQAQREWKGEFSLSECADLSSG